MSKTPQNNQKTELTLQEKGVLERMQGHVKALNESFKSLDDKAQQNVTVSSIIVAFVSAFKIADKDSKLSNQELVILGFAFVIYLFAVLLSLWARRPSDWAAEAMKPTWDESQKWIGYDLDTYCTELLHAYIGIVENNTPIINRKASLVFYSTILIFIDVILIVILAFKGQF